MSSITDHLNDADRLAVASSSSHSSLERIAVFGSECFQECKDDRVTFIGHGGLNHFGMNKEDESENSAGYTPEQFIEKIIQYKLPNSVKKIDLIGCNIGLEIGGDSYALKLASLISQNAMLCHLQVQAFSSQIVPSANFSRLIVSTSKSTDATILTGVPNNCEPQYKSLLSQIEQSTVDISILKMTLNNLEEKIADPTLPLRNKQLMEVGLAKYQQQLTENETNASEYRRNLYALREDIIKTNKPREYLDNNIICHITHQAASIKAQTDKKKRSHEDERGQEQEQDEKLNVTKEKSDNIKKQKNEDTTSSINLNDSHVSDPQSGADSLAQFSGSAVEIPNNNLEVNASESPRDSRGIYGPSSSYVLNPSTITAHEVVDDKLTASTNIQNPNVSLVDDPSPNQMSDEEPTQEAGKLTSSISPKSG